MNLDMSVYHAEMRRRLRLVEATREERAAAALDGVPSLPHLLAGRDVLVTGGSGFLGRVLIEKLLRSCPDLSRVFLLLRPRRGVAPHDRLADIVDVPLFDRLRSEQPDALSKLVPVSGDCAELGLGLSDEDRAVLQDCVSVVFHGAASVRFNDPLQKAVLLNTRGAREMAALCAEMRQLQVLVYISTGYTNLNQSTVKERLYPTRFDWATVVRAAENADTAAAMDILGRKVLDFHPNTYTFSKSLAEQIMAEAAATLPVVIVRPTIVVGAATDPLPGWLDNLNSPASLWAACAMGIVRTNRLFLTTKTTEYVPVDVVTKATMTAAWATATGQWRSDGGDDGLPPVVPVVNVAISDVHPLLGGDMSDIFSNLVRRSVPFKGVRYPIYLDTSQCWFYYAAVHIVQHLMFAVFMDGLLRLTKKRPRVLNLYRKIEVAVAALDPFVYTPLTFETHKFWELQGLIHPDDVENFDFDLDSLNPVKDGPSQLEGILKYAMKKEMDIEGNLRHIDRLFWIEMGFYAFLFTGVTYSFILLQ